MSERNGKSYIGAYIEPDTKKKLLALAKEQDRPLSYIIQKVLDMGVSHRKQPSKAN
jgi:predicted transcriptional regulator